jgi:hypothetical protein
MQSPEGPAPKRRRPSAAAPDPRFRSGHRSAKPSHSNRLTQAPVARRPAPGNAPPGPALNSVKTQAGKAFRHSAGRNETARTAQVPCSCRPGPWMVAKPSETVCPTGRAVRPAKWAVRLAGRAVRLLRRVGRLPRRAVCPERHTPRLLRPAARLPGRTTRLPGHTARLPGRLARLPGCIDRPDLPSASVGRTLSLHRETLRRLSGLSQA